MAFQTLDGIRITPKGNYNVGRFADDFQGSSWPTSFAFGGWVYSASCEIGYNGAPTEIKVSVVLEAKNQAQKYAAFNILPEDLRCDAGVGADENLYDFDFNGVGFTDFILYDYEISIENNAKILNLTFKDYSVILDKIYVGILKRQGNLYVNSSIANIAIPVNCQDCLLEGNSWWGVGTTQRQLDYGSYVGINGQTYDNFANVSQGDEIFRQWEKFFTIANSNPTKPYFDLNGGYLIIGTEEASEERCANLPAITYNFNQLLASLRYRGMKFSGAFPVATMDGDFVYKQNYLGSLREVLQQWCSDLGFAFYCQGKTFVGVNLNEIIDISQITAIADPTTPLGSDFALNQNSAIISFKQTSSLENTFKQAVITAFARPQESKVATKTPKRYVGIVPMHPLDLNFPSYDTVQRSDVFGNTFEDTALVNSFLPDSNDALNKRVEILDNRTFQDVDTAMALSYFNETLRDIYCADRALYADNPDDSAANFKALGIIPLIEITEPQEKSVAIDSVIAQIDDETSNISRDSQYYRVYIGYYYDQWKQNTVSWEQTSASQMYRWGMVKQGLLQHEPYVPFELLADSGPYSGLSGTQGARVTRVTHQFEPPAKQYFDLYDLPFGDVLLSSGFRPFGEYYPLNSWMAQLSNDWGTTKDQFQRSLLLNLDDACVDAFSQEQGYIDIGNTVPEKFQDWKLDLFRPRLNPNLEEFFNQYNGYFQKISGEGYMDRITQIYYNTQYHLEETCSKLHIIVIPDVRQHPNISVSFTKYGRQFQNPVVMQKYSEQVYLNIIRRIHEPTLNVCEIPLLQDLCDNLIYLGHSGNPSDPKYSCALEDPYNTYQEGFTYEYLTSPNSRGLEINITKNPIGGNEDGVRDIFQSTDAEGSFYYSDVLNGFLSQDQKQATLTIIYPVSTEVGDNVVGPSSGAIVDVSGNQIDVPSEIYTYYKGVLTSTVSIDNRSPEISEIYGEPVNFQNNNTVSVKVINNPVNTDLQPQLDPFSARFLTYMTVLTGDSQGQILTTVSGFHNFVKNLDSYQSTGVTKTVTLALAGTPSNFGTFKQYLNPVYGLTKLSLSVNDNGVKTEMVFSDKPPTLPKQESILNAIGPRLK